MFEHALASTSGADLAKVSWLKSRTAEIWLEKRANYTRSLAVMSMVGYVLGLGDRHTCNIMINRVSGSAPLPLGPDRVPQARSCTSTSATVSRWRCTARNFQRKFLFG